MTARPAFTLTAALGAACLAGLILPSAVHAQAMSAEEILRRIEAQRAALSDQPAQGRTRTLGFIDESTPEEARGNEAPTSVAVPAEVAPDPEAPQLASTGEDLPTFSEQLVIDLTIYFEFDSAVLKPESRAQVEGLCQAILADAGQGTYQIIGHTDAAGSVDYNLTLSKARAEEVVRYMVESCGIEAARLQAVGMGEARLKDAANPRGADNRRVEIQVDA